MNEKQRIELMRLTSTDYLDNRAREIYKRRLEQLMGAMQAARHGESPEAAAGFAEVGTLLHQYGDRLNLLFPFLLNLVLESVVELIATNNQQLILFLDEVLGGQQEGK
ncbi:MAG: hypothetical protein SVP26_10470 [Chloroflexota bacterium]|nr:hypothetical protein [Chloroflexota bacterium]